MPDLFFFGGLNFITQNKQIYELFCSANLIFWRANFKISLINNIHLVLYWCDFFFSTYRQLPILSSLIFFFYLLFTLTVPCFSLFCWNPKDQQCSFLSHLILIGFQEVSLLLSFFFFLKRLACPSSYCSPFFWSIVFWIFI